MTEPTAQPGTDLTRSRSWFTVHEAADAVYLAAFMAAGPAQDPPSEPPPVTPERPTDSESADLPEAGTPPAPEPPRASTESAAQQSASWFPAPVPTALDGRFDLAELDAASDGHRLGRVSFSALPDAREIARLLRPLHRKVPSRNADAVELDEEETAEQAAQDGLWLPRLRPVRERWLDLTLVVDANPSMALWRPTIRALLVLLRQLGTFRTVQRRLLDTAEPEHGSIPILRGTRPDSPVRRPAEIGSATGRRVVLVLTDGAHAGWRDDAFADVLARWGRSMPTSVLHLLPEDQWRPGGLRPHRAKVVTGARSTPVGRLRPNSRWSLDLPDAWLEPSLLASLDVVPVPVLELRARWLGQWARLLTGGQGGPVDVPVLLAGDRSAEPEHADSNLPHGHRGECSAHERVKFFQHIASPAAFRLATLLAAVPITLAVARFVLAEFVPEARVEHLSEVLGGDLFRSPDPALRTMRSLDNLRFHAHDGVRRELLGSLRRSETARVVRAVSTRFGDQFDWLRRVGQAIDRPDSTPDPDLNSASLHDVTIEEVVMRALSGPYLHRADRIAQRVGEKSALQATRAEPGSEMTKASARTDAPPRQHDYVESEDSMLGPSVGEPGPGPRRPGQPVFTPSAGYERRDDDAPPVWGNVPPRNPHFTGRVELLDRLWESLSAGGATTVLPAALHGMGGIGKTQIAVEYVYRHMREYDVVWWIQASQSSQIRSALTELAQVLRLPGGTEANTAVPAVLEALRLGQPHRRWLLVFDAAEEPGEVRQFFPTNGPGHVLITSRNPEWQKMGSTLPIDVFDRGESIELLRRRGPEIDESDANNLANTLGDLPLAIEQAAAWRAETGMPVAEYLRLFDEKVAEILDTSAPDDYEVSVAAAWNVSFDALSTRSPAAHQLLQVCAFFSPEPISRTLFSPTRGITVAAELDSALRDPMRLSRAIRDIHRYGLAKIDYRNNTLQLHRLVQLVLRNRMAPNRRDEMRHVAHMLLVNLDPGDPQSSQNWQRYRDILPHVYASELIECEEPWTQQLITNLINYLYRWGDHDEAIHLGERAYERWTEKLGETHPQTLQVAALLGFDYWVIGEYGKATEINRRTWDIRRQNDGENNEETLAAQFAVAADLRASGDFSGSFKLTDEAYRKAKSLFGDDDPTTLNLARRHAINLRATGQYRAAAELDDDTYNRSIETLGRDHPETLSALSGLVLDRREAGEYLWAREEQEKLAERAKQVHGENTADALRRLAYLAVGRRKAGDHEGALDLSKEVLDLFRVRYGLDTFNAMACALAYSIDLRHSGDLRSSRELGEEVLLRYRRNLGEDHPYTMCATVDLAVTMRLLGDAAGAHELNERALGKLRKPLGVDHPYAILCAINLASDVAALGDPQQAVVIGTEALELAERVLGEDHPTTLAAGLNLVFDMRAVGREPEAEQRYADVLARYRTALGEKHPATSNAAKGIRADCDIDPLPL